MKIGFLLPSVFASELLYPHRIFAPKPLAIDTINGLVKNGHEVFVFSTPDFNSEGTLIAGSITYLEDKISYYKLRNDQPNDRAVRTDEVLKRNFELAVTACAYQFALQNKLDIIHSYHDFVFTPHYFADVTEIPTIYTLHDPLPPEKTFEYQEFEKFSFHNFVSISNSQRRSSLKLKFAATVYHGMQVKDVVFQKYPSDYVLFMGRLVPEKGLHTAIAAVLELNMRLEIGTQFPNGHSGNSYFVSKIQPFLDNPLIGEPGMVHGKNKHLLYAQAKALLFPIEWEEPFGMVMLEAMSTGTPVIGFNRGSVSEVVKDGVTGFIVDQDDLERPGKGSWIIKKKGVAGIVEALKRIDEIDRTKCRAYVEENFSVEKMVDGYETVYKKVKLHLIP